MIEDDEGVRGPLVTMLELEGFEVQEARDGKEGIERATQYEPDIILCDVMMPQKDGYEVLLNIRKCERLEYTPFLFLTAKTQPEEIRAGMNLGAEDYLTKPVDRQVLLNAVSVRLSKKRRIDSFRSECEQIARLQVASRLPHELLTPLNGILGMANLLESGAKNLAECEIKNMAQSIEKSVNGLKKTIQKFLIYVELLTEQGKLPQEERVNSRKIITNCVDKVSKGWSQTRSIKASLIDASLKLSPHYFGILVEELLDNAFKFSDPLSPIQVHTSCGDKVFLLEIVNQGSLMPMNQDIFSQYDDFTQFSKEKFNQQGFGIGLAICKLIAKKYTASIEFSSSDGNTTSVIVSIPV